MKLESMSSMLRSGASAQQPPPSRLEQLMQIAQSGASAAEKRMMARAMQMQMEQETVGTLFAHIPEVKEEVEEKPQEEPVNGEETSNAHGDTVLISDAAKQQFESSRPESSNSAPAPSSADAGVSSAATT
ncbi:hypothetical protein EHV15_27420 [Paenibacillus oralis]|uniref:Uncharacterized protein n=1 Tax=Paenibacillus oralis TaxID=2490856 RepID=A0A3P3U781_9BACL|nr:hypothetical protein [Paenibacillus oralis]RRJ66231.1 hypothetical protein EHV15_27420 [Paenibacillus oralis]